MDARPLLQPAATKAECPRVHLHNRSTLLRQKDEFFAMGYGFPMRIEGTTMVYNTPQHHLGAILLYRLLASSRCAARDDGDDADIFIVPLLTESRVLPNAAERGKIWAKQSPSASETLRPVCHRMLDEDWESTLPHFNAVTANRHLFVHPEYLQIFGFCLNIPSFASRVRSSRNYKLLRRMSHVANSAARFDDFAFYSWAYPSAVHMRRTQLADAPWVPRRFARPVLMMYGGSVHGSPFARQLRELLVAQCTAYGNATCALARVGARCAER